MSDYAGHSGYVVTGPPAGAVTPSPGSAGEWSTTPPINLVPGASFQVSSTINASSAVLDNQSPYSLLVAAAGYSRWLTAWKSDVFPVVAGSDTLTVTVAPLSNFTPAPSDTSLYVSWIEVGGNPPQPMALTPNTLTGIASPVIPLGGFSVPAGPGGVGGTGHGSGYWSPFRSGAYEALAVVATPGIGGAVIAGGHDLVSVTGHETGTSYCGYGQGATRQLAGAGISFYPILQLSDNDYDVVYTNGAWTGTLSVQIYAYAHSPVTFPPYA